MAAQWVTRPLAMPIVLNQGEHLFVAVEIARIGKQSVCVTICKGVPGTKNRNYWSTSPIPYQLHVIGDYGSDENLRIGALGD